MKKWSDGDIIGVVDLERYESNVDTTTALRINFINLAIETEMLKQAELTGVNANIIIETFQTIDDIDLSRGGYDSENKRLEV